MVGDKVSGNAFLGFFKDREDTKPVNSEKEYIKDGLKYCKICNQPKQCYIDLDGKTYTMPLLCDCEQKVIAKKEAEKQRVQEETKLKKYRSQIDTGYRQLTFDKSKKKIPFANTYVKNFDKYKKDNVGLMLLGDKGTGKTFAAACIANELVNQGHNVMMANVNDVVNKIGQFYNGTVEDYVNTLQNVELLILDDLGAQRDSDFVREQIDRIIDTRYRVKKPLIITSNLSLSDLKDGNANLSRAYDRLKEMCHPIIFEGESLRKDKANSRFKDLSKELGYKIEVME